MEIYIYLDKFIVSEDNINVECDDIKEGIERLKEAKKYPVRFESEGIRPIPHPYTVAKWIREERNKRLAESDWVVLSDVPLSHEKKEAWLAYRQALRDLPQTWGLGKADEVSKKELLIDVSFVKTKEDISKLPFPNEPK